MAVLYRFLRRTGVRLRLVWIGLTIALLIPLLRIALPEILRGATEAIAQGDPHRLTRVGVFASIVAVLTIAFDVLDRIVRRATGNECEQGIQEQIIGKTIALKLVRSGKYGSGEIVTETVNNAMDGVQFSIGAVKSWVTGIAMMAAAAIYMGLIEWRLALCILGYNLVLRIFGTKAERRIRMHAKRSVEVTKENNNLILSVLANLMLVRTYDRDGFFERLLRQKERRTASANFKRSAWGTGITDATWATAKIAEFFLIYGLGGLLVHGGVTGIGSLLAFVFASDVFVLGINSFVRSLADKNTALGSVESVERFLEDTEVERAGGLLQAKKPFAIRFENVSFAHKATESGGDGRTVLAGASFTIDAGDHVLVRGPNGEGKTTLLRLMAGLYCPDRGSILFGDEDVALLGPDGVRHAYAFISQDSHMLDGDVRENIALSVTYSDARVHDAARAMNIAGCLETAPQSLSQGEKQRVNIARALYKADTTLVLGDEIFSNVDTKNVAEISERLSRHFQGRTLVLVGHESMDLAFNKVLTVRKQSVLLEEIR